MKTLLEVVLLLYCSGKLCYAVVIQFIIRANDYAAELSGLVGRVTERYVTLHFFFVSS